MKTFISIFTLALWMGCNDRPDSQPKTLPAGLTTEKFDDTPGLERAYTSDGMGAVLEEGNLVDGLKAGAWIEYYRDNNMIKSITTYYRGKREGLYLDLLGTGQIRMQCFYHNDLRHGAYKEFSLNTLIEERHYQNGKVEGVAKKYYKTGKIMEEGAFKNGTRDGISKWYDQEGKVTIEYEYKKGELVKK